MCPPVGTGLWRQVSEFLRGRRGRRQRYCLIEKEKGSQTSMCTQRECVCGGIFYVGNGMGMLKVFSFNFLKGERWGQHEQR